MNTVKVIRIPADRIRTVYDVFVDDDIIPLGTIKKDRNGRKRLVRFPLVSQNGKHLICKDIGERFGEDYWEDLPVDKVVVSEFEYRIHLRKPGQATA